MTREMITTIKTRKQEAAELVRYANPKSKTRPTIERVTELMMKHIPYAYSEGKPAITTIKVKEYHMNCLIKVARFIVTLENNKIWEISVYQHLKGRTAEEKEADKTATFPSGLFNVYHDDITEKMNRGGEPAPTETKSEPEAKTVEFKQTTKGYIGEVNGVVVWFIRDEPRLTPNEGWFVYKSADGGTSFKLIPAKGTRDENGYVVGAKQWGWNTLQEAKAFVYREELEAKTPETGSRETINQLKGRVTVKKFFFERKSNSPMNQIGSYDFNTYWTDTCSFKKDVKAKYTSKNIHGYKVMKIYTEDEYIKSFGEEKAAKIQRYYLA